MPGAELFALLHPGEVVGGQGLAYGVTTVADDHADTHGLEAAGEVEDMGEHGAAGDGVQHLGPGRAHALALAGGENDDSEAHGDTLFPDSRPGRIDGPSS